MDAAAAPIIAQHDRTGKLFSDWNVGKRKPAGLAACGVMRCGAGIDADRQLRWTRPVLLKTLSPVEAA
jgi:hypothetical protein